MKTYKVLLTRSYAVSIDAENEEDAKYYSEFFIGGEKDLSSDKERGRGKFKIHEIAMTANESLECMREMEVI